MSWILFLQISLLILLVALCISACLDTWGDKKFEIAHPQLRKIKEKE